MRSSPHVAGDCVEPGWNFRPTELQAALGIAQLAKLDVYQWKRHSLVQRYQARLAEVPEVKIPFAHIKTWHVPACHILPVLLPDQAARDRVREALHVKGIQTSHHYPPIHLFDYYQKQIPTARVSLPNTEAYSEREVTLPLHPRLTPEQVDWIVEVIKEGLAA